MFSDRSAPSLAVFGLQCSLSAPVGAGFIQINEENPISVVDQDIAGMEIGMKDTIIYKEAHLPGQLIQRRSRS